MQLNQQKPEPQAHGDGQTLDVHSVFHTIQGEGPFAGLPAVFVRLAGCNLQCPFCDTEYTDGRKEMVIADIMLEVIALKGRGTSLVVITGGEPLRQDIGPLVGLLVSRGFIVQIESNGVLAPSQTLSRVLINYPTSAVLVVSPKTKLISDAAARLAASFKYVLEADCISSDDGLPTQALGHKATPKVARPPIGFMGSIYVNPMDAKDPEVNARNIEAVKNVCLDFGYTLGLQIHKIIGVA